MPFEELRERLLTAGIAPRHVRRYLAELSDHLDDLILAQRDAIFPALFAAVAALVAVSAFTTKPSAEQLAQFSESNPITISK